jgi:hypothetical protein
MRRLALAAREGGGLGLILHQDCPSQPSTAMTRWEVASARGPRRRRARPHPASGLSVPTEHRDDALGGRVRPRCASPSLPSPACGGG